MDVAVLVGTLRKVQSFFTRPLLVNDLDVPGGLQTMYFKKKTDNGTCDVWFNLQGVCSY